MKKIVLVLAGVVLLISCTPSEDGYHYTPKAEETVTREVDPRDNRGNTNTNTVLTVDRDILHSVPFAVQAPFGDWADPIKQDGCEEMSVIMAMSWVEGKALTPMRANDELVVVSAFEDDAYGSNKDTSAEDTNDRIFRDYYGYNNTSLIDIKESADLKGILKQGSIIVAPMNGKMLNNPYFANGGPDKHMIVITGFDAGTGKFIVNDPGTKHGENFLYSEDVIMSALYNYASSGKSRSAYEKRVIQVSK